VTDTERCSRCGREVQVEAAEFVEWEVIEDGVVICPGCLTPVDHEDRDSAVMTDSADDEILRRLDPDADDQR
jgi:DNA-directed RNA polymerase subunit RPC12/RpoP